MDGSGGTGEGCRKAGWRVHASVAMGNHDHRLLETPEGNRVVRMKSLQGTCTQRFNSRHEVIGHPFQGRGRAVLVDGTEERLREWPKGALAMP